MTALNAHAIGSRAYIVTDTAAYTTEGIVGGLVSKVITIPHLRMALATRGSVMALPDFSIAFTLACASFDEALEKAPQIVADTYHDRLLYWHDLSGFGSIDVMLVGYSEKQRRAVIGFLSSKDNPQFKAFEMFVTPVLVTPPADEERMRAAGVLGPGGFSTADPVGNLLQVIELQRAVPHEIVPGDPKSGIYSVGGHAVLTEIGEAGVTQRVLRTWPDRIGETIKPAPLPPLAPKTATASLSRQQRRAADAHARKLARA